MHHNKSVLVEDLGLMDYAKAWAYQEDLFQAIVQTKI